MYSGFTSLPAGDCVYSLNENWNIYNSQDIAIDTSGNIYIALYSSVYYNLAKLNPDTTVSWSVTSEVEVFPQSMKVSPDSTFLIFTNGGDVLVKLNASTGAFLASTYYAVAIGDLYTSAISPDSSSIICGGTYGGASYYEGFLSIMSASSLT